MPKFLIIRFSSIGDLVLTSPVVRCLKQQVKNAEVHYLTKKSFSEIIEHNPFIDKKYYLEDDLSSVVRELKREKYDYVVDLHHNLRTFLIKQKLGVKSFSYDKLNFGKWLLVNLKINRLPKVHIVDRYMETIKSFGVVNDEKGLDYFLGLDEIKNAENIFQKLPETYRESFIAFVIGAKHFTKQLPAKKIISICSKINKPIVLLGDKGDFEKAKSICEAAPHVFNACGKFSLNESALLLKHASKVISHDTGLMHIAAAFKKEIISVWGNTVPEFGMSPYYGSAQVSSFKSQITNLSCRPCSKIGFEKCPKGHFKCMLEQDEEAIVKAVMS